MNSLFSFSHIPCAAPTQIHTLRVQHFRPLEPAKWEVTKENEIEFTGIRNYLLTDKCISPGSLNRADTKKHIHSFGQSGGRNQYEQRKDRNWAVGSYAKLSVWVFTVQISLHQEGPHNQQIRLNDLLMIKTERCTRLAVAEQTFKSVSL